MVVQYVPQSFGYKGLNLAFVEAIRAFHGYPLIVNFHEARVVAGKGKPWKDRVLSVVTGWMLRRIAEGADACVVSTPAWIERMRMDAVKASEVTWIPVPSNLPTVVPDAEIAEARKILGVREGALLVGHFSSGHGELSELSVLILGKVLETEKSTKAVFIGRGSEDDAVALQARLPERERSRVIGTGLIEEAACATSIAACDVMVQPYPEGATTRRGSLMACLALGKAVVTTKGSLSDSIWQESGAVILKAAADANGLAAATALLLENSEARERLGTTAKALYEKCFSLQVVAEQFKLLGRRLAAEADR